MKIEAVNASRIEAEGYLLHVGPVDGGLVMTSARPSEPRPRRGRSRGLPPAAPDLLDREREVGQLLDALSRPGPARLELYGPHGAGKTSLLRYIANHPAAGAYRDGVLYIGMKQQPDGGLVEDLLPALFEAFYEYPETGQPDEAQYGRSVQVRQLSQIRSDLRDRQALILLDDCELSGRDLDSLMQAAADSSFLIASTRPRLGQAEASIALPGLPSGAALALFERELGGFLDSAGRHAALELCASLDGRPVYIQQAAALVRESGCSILELAAEVKTGQGLAGKVLDCLSEAERRIVFALAVQNGAPLTSGHLALLAGQPAALHLLKRLERKGVLQREAGLYTLTADLQETVLNTWDLSSWLEQGLTSCLDWADGQQHNPQAVLEEAPALLGWMGWAASQGRWNEVLRLARALEGPAALGRRWGTWSQALHMGLEASQALGGRAAEAWSLHQMGTRALCLGELDEARALLIRALRIRENPGDRSGAAVTRHNLGLLLHPRRNTAERPAGGSEAGVDEPAFPQAGAAGGGRRFTPAAGPAKRRRAWAGRFRSLGGVGIILAALLLAVPMSAMLFGYSRYRSWSLANATRAGEATATEVGLLPGSSPTAAEASEPAPRPPGTAQPSLAAGPLAAGVTESAPDRSATPPSVSPAAGQGPCGPPSGWVQYSVQRQDTLAALARETGASLQDLLFANCMNGLSWLSPGEVIWVPGLPAAARMATRTAEGSLTKVPRQALAGTSTPPSAASSPSAAVYPPSASITPDGAALETTSTPTSTPTPTPTQTQPAPPDLVVTGLEIGSELALNDRGELVFPARVVVANQGQVAAGDFVVAVFYSPGTPAGPGVGRLLPFEVAGRTDTAFPHSIVPLAPNDSLVFEGKLHAGPEMLGMTLHLWAQADFCAGEAPGEGHCRVAEGDENNNLSQTVLVLLPLQPGGILQATATPRPAE